MYICIFKGACRKIMSMLQIRLSRKAIVKKDTVTLHMLSFMLCNKMIIISTDRTLLNIQFIERFVVIYLFGGDQDEE